MGKEAGSPKLHKEDLCVVLDQSGSPLQKFNQFEVRFAALPSPGTGRCMSACD